MKRDTKRRGALYTGAVAVAALLVFLGFGVTVAPELGTRLSGAAMLSNLGSHEEALAEIDRALAEHPDSFDVLVYRAAILAHGQQFEEALVAYDRVLEHRESVGTLNRSLRQDRASVLLALGRTDEFQRVRDDLAKDGVDRFVYSLDAIGAAARGEPEQAAQHWEDAYRADQNPTTRSHLHRAVVELGRIAVKERRFDDARKRFTRAQELIPQINQPFLKTAELCLAANDPEGALASVEVCRDGTPGVTPLRFRAATKLLEMGRTERAWTALDSAFRCDADAARTLLDAEPVWEEQGDAKRLAALRGAQ